MNILLWIIVAVVVVLVVLLLMKKKGEPKTPSAPPVNPPSETPES